jgi:hypothetical protein
MGKFCELWDIALDCMMLMPCSTMLLMLATA